MLHGIITPDAGGDVLNRLEQLVQRARHKVGAVTGEAPAEAPQAQEAMDFEDPQALEHFMGQVLAADDATSPFAHHTLDPARVAKLLSDD